MIAPQDRCFHNPHLTRVRKVSEFLRSQSLDRVELEPTEVFFSTTVPAHGGIRKGPGPTDPKDQNLRHHSALRRPTPPFALPPSPLPAARYPQSPPCSPFKAHLSNATSSMKQFLILTRGPWAFKSLFKISFIIYTSTFYDKMVSS